MRKTSHPPLFFILGALPGIFWSAAAQPGFIEPERMDPATPPVSEMGPPLPKVLLSQILKDESLSGLMHEPEEIKSQLQDDASLYLQIAQNRSKTQRSLKEKLIDDCATEVGINPFCLLILPSEGRDPSTRLDKATKKTLSSLTQAFESADLKTLSEASEVFLIRALKRFQGYSSLQEVAKKVLESKDCSMGPLATTLGLKAEESFPDPAYRELAIQLYKRAAGCGTDLSATKAAYRLGLLSLWENRFEDADALFAKILERPEATEYQSRSFYWRIYCQKKLNPQGASSRSAAHSLEQLTRSYPLSLHGLLAITSKELSHFSDRDPEILFRSQIKPELNLNIQAVETLQSLGKLSSAMPILEKILSEAAPTEAGFKLYLAVLLKRSGDVIRKFQVLAESFRQDASTLSKVTLGMMYPRYRFELIEPFQTKIDPYLILSLIRQESAFNERARSPAGAMGLMQLMPNTAKKMEHVPKKALFDAKTNVRLGVRFFSGLLARYEGDAELALAAYNAGPDHVDTWVKRYPVTDRLLFLDLIPFRETREYVASIVRNYFLYLQLYSSGKPPISHSQLVINTLPGGALRTGIDATKSALPRSTQ